MNKARNIIKWSWYPVLITALAVAGLVYKWPIEAVVPALVVILGIGLVVALIGARERQLEFATLRLRQLADYFNRRFMGNSSLSIFTIILWSLQYRISCRPFGCMALLEYAAPYYRTLGIHNNHLVLLQMTRPCVPDHHLLHWEVLFHLLWA